MTDHLHRSLAFVSLFAIFLLPLLYCADDCWGEPPITAMMFSRDFQQLISGSQRGLEMRTWPELALIEKKNVELDSIHDMSVSPDGKRVLIAGGAPSSSGVVQLRSWPSLELEQVWSEHHDVVYQVAWRDDGLEWVSVSWDGYARITSLNASKSHLTMTSHSGPVFAATYLSNSMVATAGADRTIAVWNAASGVSSRILRQHTGTVHALALQPVSTTSQERYLASASEDRTVRFWQPNLGRMVRFKRFSSIPRSMAWSKDGAWLNVGCDDGSVIRLDPVSLKTNLVMQLEHGVLNTLVGSSVDGLCVSDGSVVKPIELD